MVRGGVRKPRLCEALMSPEALKCKGGVKDRLPVLIPSSRNNLTEAGPHRIVGASRKGADAGFRLRLRSFADHSPLAAAEMSAQLTALKALIDGQATQIAGLQSQLDAAIAATSSNSNGVASLGLTINNNPPQNFEVQPIADKLDELINALRR